MGLLQTLQETAIQCPVWLINIRPAGTKGLLKASVEAQRSVVRKSAEPSRQQEDGFTEVLRRKRRNSQETGKSTIEAATLPEAATSQKETATRKFFAPLRNTGMETDSTSTETTPVETPTIKSGTPPPIFLTSTVKLVHLQEQLKSVVKQDFEFLTTRNGTKIITRAMEDFHAIKPHFEVTKLSYYTFPPKSEVPMNAVIRLLPTSTPAENISGGLVGLRFDVVNVKKMTITRRSSPEDQKKKQTCAFSW
jgi:hypothetical protein